MIALAMFPRRPARYLAPMALVACAIVVVAVVSSSGSGRHHAATPASSPSPHHHRSHRRVYHVHRGDTLSRIALKTGIPVTQLEALNPGLDPHTLRPGQRVKLRR
jgi:LysM repeat protein